MNDHRMGYAPATRADWGVSYGEPCADWRHRPADVPRGTPRLTPASGRCMTIGDALGVAMMAQEGPQPAPGEPAQPEVMLAVPNGAGVAFCVDLVRRPVGVVRERPTLSPAAEWPFAGQGWRNGDGGLGAQCERVRLEKLKAAEHEQWLQRQQTAMWSSQQMYADKVRA